MEENIVIVKCGAEVGTAFYISRNYLLTAYHVICDYAHSHNNYLLSKTSKTDYSIEKEWEEYDLALIKVEDREEESCLPLLSKSVRIGETIRSYGYPDVECNEGLWAKGEVAQRLVDGCADYSISVVNVDRNYDYAGLSGAPILYDNFVIGIAIEQTGDCINFVSIRKIETDLRSLAIQVNKERNLVSIPESIKAELEKCRPNYTAFNDIENALSRTDGNWIVLYGNPGCGKTTISAGFESNDETFEVIGRFFFKVPNDTTSLAERKSLNYFINWIESVYLQVSGTDLPCLSFDKKRESVAQWILMLNNLMATENKCGVIFIDGIDEVAKQIDDYLAVFPSQNLSNLKIILSCVSQNTLPDFVLESLQEEYRVEVKPLDVVACESYIRDNSGEWEKPYSFIQTVAQKTEGHPLYMNYLCRYLVQTFSEKTKEDELMQWVDTLPSIGGNIESYYNAIWKKIEGNPVTIEVLALLSQLRSGVSENDMLEMLRPNSRYSLVPAIEHLKHLFKEQDSDMYEIYHSSFRLYIANKLKANLKDANDQIVTYCKCQKDSIYSIENILHHTLCGNNYQDGLTMCNQEWADNCALQDVSPDLILHDIKECLTIAVDNDSPLEVVRLMLLAQRIENRYDSILYDNTDTLTEINLLLSKPEAAIKYLVRENTLLVNTLNAIFYLQSFFELGYEDQAIRLADAIDAIIRLDMHKDSKALSTKTITERGMFFVIMDSAGYGGRNMERFFNSLQNYMMTAEDEENYKAMAQILKTLSPYYLSSKVRKGKFVNLKLSLEKLGVDMNKEAIIMASKILSIYNELDSGVVKQGKNDSYHDLVVQMDEILSAHSFDFSPEELPLVIDSMIYDSRNSAVIISLINSLPKSILTLDFRDPNGVDIKTENLLRYYTENLYIGYADYADNYLSLLSSTSGWEGYCESLIREVAYLNGRILRKSAESIDLTIEYERIVDILSNIDFSFWSRTQWDRSYLLPEELFPFIYDKIVEIFRDFFPENIKALKSHIENRSVNQLSLYVEGYCATLLRMAEKIAYSSSKEFSLWLSGKVFDFILYAVQNRSMRCSYLMKLALNFAVAGDLESCKNVYREILKSSMGPEWYKEAQLDLLSCFKDLNIHFSAEQAIHASALYEEASGEMTFQRYVQQEKNAFVGILAKCSSLSDAIGYYRYETLPTYQTVVNNAEVWKVDMPKVGEGYDLGANHLIEASAMLHLLEVVDASPLIKYALSELFWDNDDKLHNDSGYVRLHTSILREMDAAFVMSELLPRMADYYANEYNREGEKMYLSDYDASDIPETIKSAFETALKSHDIEWNRRSKTGPSELTMHEDTPQVTVSLTDTKSLLVHWKKDIVSPISCYWYSLSQFIKPLGAMLNTSVNDLYDVVTKHFDINVVPCSSTFNKFDWIKGFDADENREELLMRFLVWFLVHPNYTIVRRAENVIKWLANYDKRILHVLIDSIIRPSEIGEDVRSSHILCELASVYYKELLEIFKVDNKLGQLAEIESFSVVYNLYEIGMIIKEKLGDDAICNTMKSLFPDNVADRGDVWFEHIQMMFVEDVIDNLNQLHVTGGKEFAKPYTEAVDTMLADGTITCLCKDCRYVRRSFYLNDVHNSRYNRTMIGVMDKILYGKVAASKAKSVYYTLNRF